MSNQRPNILWLMTDEQRRDSLGCYGSPWARTPNLDRIADEGVVLENAITPSPVCQPARVSFLTGCYPVHTGTWTNNNAKGGSLDHLTYRFADAGYRTATFGKQHYGRTAIPAFQTEVHLSYKTVHAFRYDAAFNAVDFDAVQYPPQPYPWIFGGRFPLPIGQTAEAEMVDAAIGWLDAQDRSQPFLLRVSFNAPHTPVVVPEPFDKAIDPDDVDLPAESDGLCEPSPRWLSESLASAATSSRLTRDQIRLMRAWYYRLVAAVDFQFGRLLDHMRSRGLLDNTIIAFLSDHGTHLGDYGLVQKQTFFEPVVTVPMWFSAPGIPGIPGIPGRIAGGKRLRTPVSAMTLLPTLMELAGLEIPGHVDAPSIAAQLLDGTEPQPQPVFSELTLDSFKLLPGQRLVMVRDGDWKLSLRMDPQPGDGALFNIADDPLERRNLFDRPEHREVQERLALLIDQHLGAPTRCAVSKG